MSRPVLAIQMTYSLTRLLLLWGQREQLRLTLAADVEVGQLWELARSLCQEDMSVVLFADGLPLMYDITCSPNCTEEGCNELHIDCAAAQREFAQLRARLATVAS